MIAKHQFCYWSFHGLTQLCGMKPSLQVSSFPTFAALLSFDLKEKQTAGKPWLLFIQCSVNRRRELKHSEPYHILES